MLATGSRLARYLSCLSVAGLALSGTAMAGDAHQGVKAEPGEIVLLRDVSARHAYRPAPPGMALIVDPSPKREIDMMLGTGELSDDEYAALGSGNPGGAGSATTIERVIGSALGGTLGGQAANGGGLSGSGITSAIGVSMGAVGGATAGVGDQVRGALAQFPLVSPPTAGVPGG